MTRLIQNLIKKSRAYLFCALAVLAAVGSVNAGFAAVPAEPCEQFSQSIPERPTGAPLASKLVPRLAALDDSEREIAIAAELQAGNIPQFLRRLAPIRLSGQLPSGKTVQVTLCVMPDYLAIGSDQDFLLVPMRLQTALAVASEYGFLLPTTKIVDAIYEQASLKLVPQPLPATAAMRSTGYYSRHNELVAEQRSSLGLSLGTLTAGDKKDLVLSNRLWRSPQQLAIYGWHRAIDRPIQPLSTVHGARYVDYSHGVRLVASVAYVDGKPEALLDVLEDTRLAPIVSSDGTIRDLPQLLSLLKTPR